MLKREMKISPTTSGRLDCLATTYSVVRHIDVVMCRDFSCDLEHLLRAGPQNYEFSTEAHDDVLISPHERSWPVTDNAATAPVETCIIHAPVLTHAATAPLATFPVTEYIALARVAPS